MSKYRDHSHDLRPLVDRLHSGDQAAVPLLIERSCERLRRMTRNLLKKYPAIRPWEDTDDVMQSAVLRLQKALQDVQPDTVKAYFSLAGVQIRRQLIDLLRHYAGPQGEANHRAEDDADDSQALQRLIRDKPDSSAGPSTLAEWTEFHSKVEQLPDDERQVFDLVFYEGLSQLEVAELLSVTDRTVKRRWRMAREKLYRLLKGAMPGNR